MHATVRSVIEATTEEICILDTEASPEHLSRGTARYADAMYAVVEPYYKSLETGRRMSFLAKDLGLPRVALIANKVRDEGELAALREFADRHELDVAGVIPYDDQLPEAERAGVSPLDRAPDSRAVAAISELAPRLVADGRA
jgi:CO dehydrogenase maturation factor